MGQENSSSQRTARRLEGAEVKQVVHSEGSDTFRIFFGDGEELKIQAVLQPVDGSVNVPALKITHMSD